MNVEASICSSSVDTRNGPFGEVDRGYGLLHALCPETFGLLPDKIHEFRTHDSVRKPREILNIGSRGKLPSGFRTFKHKRLKIRPRRVKGRGQPRRAGTHDDHLVVFFQFFHLAPLQFLFRTGILYYIQAVVFQETKRTEEKAKTPSAQARTPMESAKKTPLYDRHAARGAVFGETGGFLLPKSYGDPEGEAKAVRESVGVIDISSRGKIMLSGADHVKFLQGMLTNDVKEKTPGDRCLRRNTHPPRGK